MNEKFKQIAMSRGEEGKAWLESIPQIISQSETRWNIKVGSPFNLSYNYVAPAERVDGSQAVLKIGFPSDREFQTEIRALEVFNGDGIERLLEEDREKAVILIERIMPGVPLSTLVEADDEQATRILTRVMKKLHKPPPGNHSFITIADWAKGMQKHRQQFNGSGPLPASLFEKAEHLFEELLATSQEPMLVHGDLHHDNVLSSDREGWLAIDPKGIAAEPAYDTAAMLRNPHGIERRADLSSFLTRRIQILSEELQVDPKRIQQWGIAQTVLSAVWTVEWGMETRRCNC